MSEEIKEGDMVMLKTGGPEMTVTACGKGRADKDLIYCTWFDKGGAVQRTSFPPYALKKVKE